MRQGHYTVTFDRDFDGVIAACAGRRQGRWHLTWITPRIMHAYAEAFDAGHAHSFEVWNKAGELVAGGYGIAFGGGFHRRVAVHARAECLEDRLGVLNWHLAHWGFRLQRRQADEAAWDDMGFRDIPRRGISCAAGRGRAPARQERPLAGRDRLGDVSRIGSRDNSGRSATSRYSITFPISGIFAIHRRMRG